MAERIYGTPGLITTEPSMKIVDVGCMSPDLWHLSLTRLGMSQDEIEHGTSVYSDDPVAGKVVDYGRSVIAGIFPPDGVHHRDYLGRRHFENMAVNLILYSEREVREGFLRRRKTVQVPNEADLTVQAYSVHEAQSLYTFQDFTHKLGPRFDVYENGSVRHYLWKVDHWSVEEENKADAAESGKPAWETVEPRTEDISRRWLLGRDRQEWSPLLYASTALLGELLRDEMSHRPERVYERFREDEVYRTLPKDELNTLERSKWFGIIEQEVPTAVDLHY